VLHVDTLRCAFQEGAAHRIIALRFGNARRRTVLRAGHSARKSPKFSQISKFLLSNLVKLLSKAEEQVSTSFPLIFAFPFAFHVDNISS